MLLDLLLTAVLGLCFAAAARRAFVDGRAPFGMEVRAVSAFAIALRLPLAAYLYLAHTDWYTHYLGGAGPPSFAVAVLVVLGHAGALLGGYLGGYSLARRGGETWVVRGVMGGASVWLLVLAALHERLSRYGTGAEYLAGTARALVETRALWVLIWCALGLGVSAGLTCAYLSTLRRPETSKR